MPRLAIRMCSRADCRCDVAARPANSLTQSVAAVGDTVWQCVTVVVARACPLVAPVSARDVGSPQ
eukprot:11195580-Alexandrium_andersonii.AAC.1